MVGSAFVFCERSAKGGARSMNGGECGYACGFCQRPFRTFTKKLRHLKECKEMVPDTRGKHIHPGVPRRRVRW